MADSAPSCRTPQPAFSVYHIWAFLRPYFKSSDADMTRISRWCTRQVLLDMRACSNEVGHVRGFKCGVCDIKRHWCRQPVAVCCVYSHVTTLILRSLEYASIRSCVRGALMVYSLTRLVLIQAGDPATLLANTLWRLCTAMLQYVMHQMMALLRSDWKLRRAYDSLHDSRVLTVMRTNFQHTFCSASSTMLPSFLLR